VLLLATFWNKSKFLKILSHFKSVMTSFMSSEA
jgi:hypothetical protein